MKKFLVLLFILFSNLSYATTLNITYTNEQAGQTIRASHWNQDMQDIQNWANNNNIDGSTNIATNGVTTSSIANGAVTDAKIAAGGITTAGKLSGSAFTGLSSIPSGAGEIPTANLGTGTANSSTYLRGDQTWQNPVFGASNVSALWGSYTSKSVNTAFQATTDGMFCAAGLSSDSTFNANMYTDGSNPPTTVRCTVTRNTGVYGGCCIPVRKNDFYKVDSGPGAAYFISLGS